MSNPPKGTFDAASDSGFDDSGNLQAQDSSPAHDSAPAPPPTSCSLGRARVFVTLTLYDGDFGG